MNAKKPSPAQQEVIDEMAKSNDGQITRLMGGYWTLHAMTYNGRGAPDWYASTSTIRAMERLGWLRRRNVHPDELKDERELTDEGRALAVRKDPQYASSGKEQSP